MLVTSLVQCWVVKASTDIIKHREPRDDTNTFHTSRIASNCIYKTEILEEISITGLPLFTVWQYSYIEIPNRPNRNAPTHEAVRIRPKQRRATAVLCRGGGST